MHIVVHSACGCNIGLRRKNNEDNYYFNKHYFQESNVSSHQIITSDQDGRRGPIFFAVFDGMGGADYGEVASEQAAKSFSDWIEGRNNRREVYKEEMAAIIRKMDQQVSRKAKELKCHMGTTVVIGCIGGNNLMIANVGDSRALLFRDHKIWQISKDHSDEVTMRKLGITSRKPLLTQYIGVSAEEVEVDPFITCCRIQHGDYLLLCSDGLTDMLTEQQIAEQIESNYERVDRVVECLIRRALDTGGRDNITVIGSVFKRRLF